MSEYKDIKVEVGMILQDSRSRYYVYEVDIKNNNIYYINLKNFCDGETAPGKETDLPLYKSMIERSIEDGAIKTIKR